MQRVESGIIKSLNKLRFYMQVRYIVIAINVQLHELTVYNDVFIHKLL